MNKKIYIACPAKVATGGPELLHQLCYKLNKSNYSAFMYYYGEGIENPVNDGYKIYNNPYVIDLVDSSENLLIVPEVNVNLLKNFKLSQKVIWWLSVDNYLIPKMAKKHLLKSLGGLTDYHFKRKKDVIHFAQSQYAIEFLKKEGISEDRIYYLSDYLNCEFLKSSTDNNNYIKEDVVLYNPKKGYEFTKKLMDLNPDIKWVPLQNMTAAQMSETMKKSKVYIDFGNHPGKDRIPRETAISGCCVITGKRGSAKFKEDVNIPEEFKFDDNEKSFELIINKIREIFNNFEEESNKFTNYRNIIMNEEKLFEDDIKRVFSEIIK